MGGMPDIPAQPKEKSVYTYDEYGNLVSSEEVNGDSKKVTTYATDEEKKNESKRKEQMSSIQEQMNDFLPQLNTVDPTLQQQIDEQAALMTDSASKQLDSSYNDTMKTLADQAAARFGSTQNAYYDKERDSINKTLAEQQAAMAKDIEASKTNMQNSELSNRSNYYNNLQSMYNSLQSGSNDYNNENVSKYNQTMQANQMSNNFDASTYATYMSGVQSQIAAQAQKQSSLFGMFSDVALKENIRPLESVLDKLDKIGVYNFNYLGSDDEETGVMAQQIEKEFPELVSESQGYKMVNYGGLIPILLQAVKELKEKVGG